MIKEEIKEIKKMWYQRNKEKIKEKSLTRYYENIESERIKRKEYQKENREKVKKHKKKWREETKEKAKEYQKQYSEVNKEKIKNRKKEYRKTRKKEISEYNKIYGEKNKDKIKKHQKEYCKEKRQSNPLFKLSQNVRRSISQSFKNNSYTKKSRTHEILGCSFEFFKSHIESLWEPWMNWSNYGSINGKPPIGKYQCWDIDHITRLSTALTEKDIIKLNHYINLQPLCSYTNRYIKR